MDIKKGFSSLTPATLNPSSCPKKTNRTFPIYKARPAMIRPKRPAPATKARVSEAALPEEEDELPEEVEVADPVWWEPDAPLVSEPPMIEAISKAFIFMLCYQFV